MGYKIYIYICIYVWIFCVFYFHELKSTQKQRLLFIANAPLLMKHFKYNQHVIVFLILKNIYRVYAVIA